MKLLSLCMIVKNEEKVIQQCLDSVQTLVDEIIIVDTGSTDHTISIASEYGAKIYSHEWNNDFAAARNVALAHASAKWIISLDADEYVDPTLAMQLRADLETYDISKPLALIVPILNFNGSSVEENRIYQSSGERIFTNHHHIKYVNPIHEQLTYPKGLISYHQSNFNIYHTGYLDSVVKEKNKSERNLSILEARLSCNPTPYDHFTIGNEYHALGQLEKAYSHYRIAVQVLDSTSSSWYFHALDRCIRVEMQLQLFTNAWEHIQFGAKHYPACSDYITLQGLLLYELGFLDRSEKLMKQALLLSNQGEKRQTQLWLIHNDYSIRIPNTILLEISRKKGDASLSFNCLSNLVQLNTKDYNHLQELLSLLMIHETVEQAALYLDQLLIKQGDLRHLILYRLCSNIGYWALAEHYYSICCDLQLPLSPDDYVRIALWLRDSDLLKAHMVHIDGESAANYQIIEKILFQMEAIYTPDVSDEQKEKFIRELFHYQLFDALDDMTVDSNNLFILANYLYSRYFYELALDYYMLLLERHALDLDSSIKLAYLLKQTDQHMTSYDIFEDIYVEYQSLAFAGTLIDDEQVSRVKDILMNDIQMLENMEQTYGLLGQLL